MKKRQDASLKNVLNVITKRPLRKNPKRKFNWNWKMKKENH